MIILLVPIDIARVEWNGALELSVFDVQEGQEAAVDC